MFQTMTFCAWALIIWIRAVAVSSRKAKGGDVIAAVMSIFFGSVHTNKAVGHDVFKMIQRKTTISYDSQGKEVEKISGDIDIHDVHFAYPFRPEKSILQGFSLSILAGNMVVLVGSSGCGKSTVIALVQRFYDLHKVLKLFRAIGGDRSNLILEKIEF
ncbi:hypothetical protein F3Y22_tig00111835pilonHSYRG00107 [Hibiscus syriacus]|uniref:ABC transporter domain-containing protein n=1 Tax=Hibiscus syriacus TaxID=106335 RepID=A0A6A2YEG7_HIBSY|nr:hypothetical protein F3Y22_tig00111835pilonHSYRG00107 [Hibiscus syriacus]